ncbi:MAG: ATP-dependent 6-phosphofructokinase [Pseudomonadota bacterium]|nr:ATP-dependent 6-phosphofructokinase [Pseudomonadota bacterium]
MTQRIAILTSGGDAPGMNAAIRAAVRAGLARQLDMFGVRHGYAGLIAGDFRRLGAREVGGIIDRGGTMLGTSRCPEFLTDAGQQTAIRRLAEHEIAGLIVLGGNGSQHGSLALAQRGVAVIGIASTIDNDLAGSDVTLGATTALDVALEAISRLRVTAAAHGRVFLVEVMGRACGYLALMAGIAGGAEAIVIPEAEQSPEQVALAIQDAYRRGKSHAIVVIAEGAKHNADALARHFTEHAERLNFELRVTKLGHVQRGGSPGAFDRLSATLLGAEAIERWCGGEHGILLGLSGAHLTVSLLRDAVARPKPLQPQWLHLAHVLSR